MHIAHISQLVQSRRATQIVQMGHNNNYCSLASDAKLSNKTGFWWFESWTHVMDHGVLSYEMLRVIVRSPKAFSEVIQFIDPTYTSMNT